MYHVACGVGYKLTDFVEVFLRRKIVDRVVGFMRRRTWIATSTILPLSGWTGFGLASIARLMLQKEHMRRSFATQSWLAPHRPRRMPDVRRTRSPRHLPTRTTGAGTTDQHHDVFPICFGTPNYSPSLRWPGAPFKMRKQISGPDFADGVTILREKAFCVA